MYRKQQYVFQDGLPVLATVRNYLEKDFEGLMAVQRESFPPPFPEDLWWTENQLESHLENFPEGALCIEVNGEIAGSVTSLIVDFDPLHPHHTWEDITDNGSIGNHQPDGNTLYIADICVKPSYRKLDLGKLLMQSMYEHVIQFKLDRLLGGGRLPGYHRYANEWTPEQYVQQIISGQIKDPVITFLLRCGRTPVCLVPGYLEDAESRNFGLLMEWKNPFCT
ncbi:GNAT family N-acetyltransferase [Planococcus shenhongbingii]|uniref:GNAT family N-acetyltransferase n=1 Tax=Planococcus shenhongbingii TaxID=3058398 RepID=UPI0026351F98|nr:GNAT family N-acetyltransferase [Planococcus sp. N016]WKA59506.1 GNAT family N-acetyltransferase [Planococcus sp. N016]